jgi:catechol-2,3-dioxygenase
VPDLRRAERSWGWLLGEVGFELARRWATGCVWREGGTGIVIEASPDMVPGMLHSRLRPGMNHVAFGLDNAAALAGILEAAPGHGWAQLGDELRHPLSAELSVGYLEDADGFEVELVAPNDGPG